VIQFPRTPSDAAAATGELRAGGTDLNHRRHRGLSSGGAVVDLRECTGMSLIGQREEGFAIGARVRITKVASDPDVRRLYPGLAAAAGGLATPQIRAIATLGGNLLQHPRCPYYRAPELVCLRKGGTVCLARIGAHQNHVIFEQGASAAPSASTLGVALLAHDALVWVQGREAPLTIDELYGVAGRPDIHHTLAEGEVLTEVVLPAPFEGERAAYFRTIHRSRAEWPIVECSVRLDVVGGSIRAAAVAVGAVANSPMRLPRVEQDLAGQAATADTVAAAAAKATEGATPMPQTAWKVDVLRTTVQATLEQALGLEVS